MGVLDRTEDLGRLASEGRVPGQWNLGWSPGHGFASRHFRGLLALVLQREEGPHLVVVSDAASGTELARTRAPSLAAARELAYFLCRGALVRRVRW
jgi:hypothetical protein